MGNIFPPLEETLQLNSSPAGGHRQEQTGTHWGGPRTTPHHAHPIPALPPPLCPSWTTLPELWPDCEMQSAVPATLTVWNPHAPKSATFPSARTMARGLFCLAALSWPLETSPALFHSPSTSAPPAGSWVLAQLPVLVSHLKTVGYAVSFATTHRTLTYSLSFEVPPHPPNGGVRPHPIVPHRYFRSPLSPLVTS